MNRIARFEKVSFPQFYKNMETITTPSTKDWIKYLYDNIQLPKRATSGSAGYDFYLPYDVTIPAGATVKIPTGIRVHIREGWWLAIVPRSSLGFKYRMQLDNTVGVIDSDYYYSDNEGHIFAKITNDGRTGKEISLKAGDRFMQGIFLPYGITYDDTTNGIRTGGIGSTNTTHIVEFGQLASEKAG